MTFDLIIKQAHDAKKFALNLLVMQLLLPLMQFSHIMVS